MNAPDPPSPGQPDRASAPRELRRQFWLLVGIFNAAVLATSLGVFVLVFWSRPALGAGLVGVGLVAFVLGWRRYRGVRQQSFDSI